MVVSGPSGCIEVRLVLNAWPVLLAAWLPGCLAVPITEPARRQQWGYHRAGGGQSIRLIGQKA